MFVFTAIKLFMTGPKVLSMLSNVASFVIKNWKPIALALMISTLFYQNFQEELWFIPVVETLPTQKIKVIELTKALTAAVTANKVLANTIQARNIEIGKWKDVSKRLERNNAKLEGTLSQMRVHTVESAQVILDGETPNSCDAAFEYLRRAASGELQWPEQQSQ